MKQNIIRNDALSSCYFRTSTKPPFRKALLQITERCNLHCAHCFVSAGAEGAEMSLHNIEKMIPKLKELNIISTTLTGGEPFLHPDIIQIVKMISDMDIKVSICTNATLITALQMQQLADIGQIHINVSLDGFRPESHGKFRGDIRSFETTKSTIRLLGEYRLLHGLLVTPNKLAEIEEYKHICQFAVENRASYVLMNPLSQMGRGISSQNSLGSSNQMMEQIRKETAEFQQLIQVIYVRFPNIAKLPLGSCEAGNIIYIFTRGELTICPYLVFAAKTPQSQYNPNDFIVGNIFTDSKIAAAMGGYDLIKKYPSIAQNKLCLDCKQKTRCGKGCPAAIVASGKSFDSLDSLCFKGGIDNDEV